LTQPRYDDRGTLCFINRKTESRCGPHSTDTRPFCPCIEIKQTYTDAYRNRGLAHGKKVQFDQALADFDKTIELNPQSSEAYNNRAVVYYSMQEYYKAWEDVHKAQSMKFQVYPGFLVKLRQMGVPMSRLRKNVDSHQKVAISQKIRLSHTKNTCKYLSNHLKISKYLILD